MWSTNFDPDNFKRPIKLSYDLIDAKNKYFETPKYYQVFSNKYGFLSNLSILDLLFNLGPNAIDYLYSINLKL